VGEETEEHLPWVVVLLKDVDGAERHHGGGEQDVEEMYEGFAATEDSDEPVGKGCALRGGALVQIRGNVADGLEGS